MAGERGGGDGGGYAHRIVSMARSAGHVAQGQRATRGKSMGPITSRLRRRSRK